MGGIREGLGEDARRDALRFESKLLILRGSGLNQETQNSCNRD